MDPFMDIYSKEDRESPSLCYIQGSKRLNLWDGQKVQKVLPTRRHLLRRVRLCFLGYHHPRQSLLVIEAQVSSPGVLSGLVVENIVLRQRAAVHMADVTLGTGTGAVLLAGGNGVDHGRRRRRNHLRHRLAAAAPTVGLPVEIVEVLGDAEACGVQQELRQEVARWC